MTTIDLIDVFCRQSIIGIDPIEVFLTIGAQLCRQVIKVHWLQLRFETLLNFLPVQYRDSDLKRLEVPIYIYSCPVGTVCPKLSTDLGPYATTKVESLPYRR